MPASSEPQARSEGKKPGGQIREGARLSPDPGANEPYAFAYLLAYAVELPEGAASLTLPDDGRIRVLAVTVSDEGRQVRPARPLYDVLGGRER